jgi:hypothetical protein
MVVKIIRLIFKLIISVFCNLNSQKNNLIEEKGQKPVGSVGV